MKKKMLVIFVLLLLFNCGDGQDILKIEEDFQQELGWKNDFQKLIDKLFVKPWVVHSQANYSDPKNIFDYLGRYLQKAAISNNNI